MYGKNLHLAKKNATKAFLLFIVSQLINESTKDLSVRVVCTSLLCVAKRFFHAFRLDWMILIGYLDLCEMYI